MRTITVVVLLILSAAGATFAQSGQPKAEVFVGYSFLNSSVPSETLIAPSLVIVTPGKQANHGADVQFAYNLTPVLSLVADLAGHHGSADYSSSSTSPNSLSQTSNTMSRTEQDDFMFLFGPRLSHQSGSLRLFAHVLVGGAQVRQSIASSTTSTGSITLLSILGTNSTSTTTTVTQTSTAGQNIKGTGFAFATGGGIEWLHGRWALRIVQIEYLHTGGDSKVSSLTSVVCTQPGGASCGSTNSVLNGTTTRESDDVRLATGLVFQFGKR